MTGFRLAQNLNAYSGGTVRDLHPVFYNPVELLPLPQALKRNINFAASIHDGLWNVKQKRKRRGRLYSFTIFSDSLLHLLRNLKYKEK